MSLSDEYTPTSDEVIENNDSSVIEFQLLEGSGFDQDVLSQTTAEGYTSIRVHNTRLHETTTIRLDPSESKQLYKQLKNHFSGDNNNE